MGAESRMEKVRAGYGYEGEVLYFLDKEDKTVGLVKKKTAWYVLCLRLKSSPGEWETRTRKEGGMSKQKENLHLEKLERRINEIRTWLDLSKTTTRHWCLLGKTFFKWTLEQLKQNPEKLEELCARGGFPQQWQSFLAQADISDKNPSPDNKDVLSAEDSIRNSCSFVLEDPSEASPVVTVAGEEEKDAKSYLATCVVRRVDLLGKNMKKMQSAVQKSRERRTKNPALPSIGVHDLAKVEKEVIFAEGDPAIVPPGGTERLSVAELRVAGLLGQTTQEAHCPDTHPFLRQGSTVISIHPLLTSKETKICEETEDIFLEVSSAISETAAEEALGGFLKQIYHMGISLEGRDKFIHVEKGQVISPEGSTRYFPFTFHI